MTYDIIIIGAGSAGIPCAICAAERGLSVLLVEKENEVGGTLHVTAGHMSAGGTRRQKECSIDDNTANHWADVQRISHNTADEIVAKKAVELAPVTIDWLQDLGYRFHEKAPLIIYGHEAYDQPRTYFGADDYFGGPIMQPGKAVLKALLPRFEKLVTEKKITLLTSHSLQKILVKNNFVTGITVMGNDELKTLQGKKYVLTTGGYASSKDFFESHHPYIRLISTANESSTGDGIKAAMEIGAIFHNTEKHISTLGGVETEPGSGRANFWQAWARVSNSHDRIPREIYVNEYGNRFMNEFDLTVDERERIVLQQPNQRFYLVFDDTALHDGTSPLVQWTAKKFQSECMQEKCCWQSDSIEQLARKINVPATSLLATVNQYNNAVEVQKEDAYNRTNLTFSVLKAPYYALLVNAYSLISFGGIKVNEHLQISNTDGSSMENLYAAGEILGAGATSGNAFCGGMLLTPAISFGKWLGETI